MTPVTARETAAGRAASRVGTRVAARCAYGAGIGGIVVSLLFIGFYTLEIQHPGDAPLGTASDVAGVTIGLLIPAALALGGYLPARRSATVIQAAGIMAMAVGAVAGPLIVAGLLSFDVATPISAASVLVHLRLGRAGEAGCWPAAGVPAPGDQVRAAARPGSRGRADRYRAGPAAALDVAATADRRRRWAPGSARSPG